MRTLVYAPRGASYDGPEKTLSTFRLARWVQGLEPLPALHPEHHQVDESHLSWARAWLPNQHLDRR